MTRAQEYRYLAERVRDRARQADINLAAEWEQLARCYLLLAEQAERNEQADILTIRYCPSPIRKLRLVGNARKRRSEELAFKLPKSKFPRLSEDTTCDRLSEPPLGPGSRPGRCGSPGAAGSRRQL